MTSQVDDGRQTVSLPLLRGQNAHEADVSVEDEVVGMVARMAEEFGMIDIMVANAGLQRDAAVVEMMVAQWQKVLDVNLTGQFLCAREAGVAPGAIRTQIDKDAWDTPAAEAELLKLIPYRRVGDPADIANAVTVPASDLMDYVAGTTIFVAGGMTVFPGFATGG